MLRAWNFYRFVDNAFPKEPTLSPVISPDSVFGIVCAILLTGEVSAPREQQVVRGLASLSASLSLGRVSP